MATASSAACAASAGKAFRASGTGSRFAAVGWVRSDIRDPDQRAILFDLDESRREVFAKEGKSALFDRLTQAYTNLVRLWTEF